MNKLSTWLMLLGAFVLIAGAAALVTAFGPEHDPTAMGLGSMLFSVGSIIIAAGFYLKARSVEASMRPGRGPELVTDDRRRSPKCAICGGSSTFRCTTHLVNLCANCMSRHDEASCAYIPLNRKAGRSGAVGAWR